MALTGVVYKWRLDNTTYVYITDILDRGPFILTNQTCDEEKIKEIVSSWDEETYRLKFNRMVTIVHNYPQWANLRFLDYSVYLKECSECEESLRPSLPTDIKINAKIRTNEELVQPLVTVSDGACIVRDGEKVKVFNMEFIMPKFSSGGGGTITLPFTYNEDKQSYMFGEENVAIGFRSVAEGYITYTGAWSQEENDRIDFMGTNEEPGSYAHAEGNVTIASGPSAHSEGELTLAAGKASHAEGSQTVAAGYATHAEGALNKMNGDFSHIEGVNNSAEGENIHIEGMDNYSSGSNSHVEGNNNQNIDSSCHIEGSGNVATGSFYSHIEGTNNNCESWFASHIEGDSNYTDADYTHVEGAGNSAHGEASHVEGKGNYAYGEASHVCGKYATIDEAGDFIFQVGVGEDEFNRKDAFAIRRDGTVVFFVEEE